MTPRHAWLAVTGVAAVSALWLDFGRLQEFQHADSLIPALVSTQRWTPYFWGQDRFGMLVPLVAMPVRAPLANLLLQEWIMITAAVLAPFVIARFAIDRTAQWLVAGALTHLLLFGVTAPVTQFDWLLVQPYALSLTLGFAGLLMSDRRTPAGAAGGFVLLALAHWVNVGVAVPLAAAVVVRRTHARRGGALVAASAAVGAVLTRVLPRTHTTTAMAPPGAWLAGWSELARSAATVVAHPAVLAAAMVTAAAAAVIVARRRADRLHVMRAAAIPAAAAVVNWLLIGASEWVRLNLYYPRYTFPSLLLFGVALAIVVAGAARGHAAALALAAWCANGVVVIIIVGAPSPARVERGFDARFGRTTPAVIAAGAAAIAGDYWTVWPAVFHADMATARLASPRQVFGLTYRSEATDALWCAPGTPTVVVSAPDDDSAIAVAARHGVALMPRTHSPDAAVFDARIASCPADR